MPRKRIEDGPNALRIAREQRNLSQQRAADLVGVSRPMWSSWECRARQMTIVQLNTIQERLQLSDHEVDRIRKWWTSPRKKRKAKKEQDEATSAAQPVETKKKKRQAA